MVCDAVYLTNITNIANKPVTLGNGHKIPCSQVGTLRIGRLLFHDVLLVPGLDRNLLSVSRTDFGKWEFDKKGARLNSPSGVLLTAALTNALYIASLPLPKDTPACYKVEVKGLDLLQLWHNRLGHCNV